MGDGKLCHFAVIAVKDFLLEMLRIGAGIMFCALQTHFDPPHGQVAALLFYFPTAGGEITQIVVDAITEAVVQQPFGATFEQRWLRRRCRGTDTMAVLGIPGGSPIISVEEFSQAAVATGRHKGQ